MKAFITGVTGFAGSHLADLLLAADQEVVGISRQPRWPIGAADLANRVRWYGLSLLDTAALQQLLTQEQPDFIYHLAGQANVSTSFQDPQTTFAQNVTGTESLLSAVSAAVPSARILFVSTGAVYGTPEPSDLPVTEQTRLRPTSPYAESKIAGEQLVLAAHRNQGLAVLVARAFNHLGPRQQAGYAGSDFARQIAFGEHQYQQQVVANPQNVSQPGTTPLETPIPPIRTGRLTVERDFTDVRDVVVAYRLLVEQGVVGEIYNVASGKTILVSQLLQDLLQMTPLAFTVQEESAMVRSRDVQRIQVNPLKIRQLGWQPHIPLDQSLRDILADWRLRQASVSETC